MESIKRARLEPRSGSSIAAATLPMATTQFGGQSIVLSNSASTTETIIEDGALPSNVFLTICDENSDESQEYFAIDTSTLAHIKQEHGHNGSREQVQYRIVNQHLTTRSIPQTDGGQVPMQLLPPSVQLPSGCEIYLVKEYVGGTSTTNRTDIVEALSTLNDAHGIHDELPMPKAVKIEPDSLAALQASRGDCVNAMVANDDNMRIGDSTGASSATNNSGKRSFILEAYKKRDDKRRATHNEVERRRRDKINSWIFKLKEMLPAETNNNTSVATEQQQQQRNISNNSSCRSPPSDSKSQILIKACDYIRAMQEELKSLRECLTENESLRASNQRLQTELNKWKSERNSAGQAQVTSTTTTASAATASALHSTGYNVSLNSLRGGDEIIFGTSTLALSGDANASGDNVNAPCVYAKRELIIRDYVD